MYKAKGRFLGAGHISSGRSEDEAPLTQRNNHGGPWSSEAMGSQLEACYQGTGRHTRQNPKLKKEQPQRLNWHSPLAASCCEDIPLSDFSLVRQTLPPQKRQHWSTTWYMQMSAVVVALALAAFLGLTFALRNADKIRDAGRGVDVDSDDAAGENGTNITAKSHGNTTLDDGGSDSASSTELGSKGAEPEPESRPAFTYTRSAGGQSNTPVYNTGFYLVAHQTNMEDTSSSPPRGVTRGSESAKRTVVRMNRKEWLDSRGWHLA